MRKLKNAHVKFSVSITKSEHIRLEENFSRQKQTKW